MDLICPITPVYTICVRYLRTRQLDGAHVEYFRGIANPIGVKVGPGMTRDWLTQLIDVLDHHPSSRPLYHFCTVQRGHLPRNGLTAAPDAFCERLLNGRWRDNSLTLMSKARPRQP